MFDGPLLLLLPLIMNDVQTFPPLYFLLNPYYHFFWPHYPSAPDEALPAQFFTPFAKQTHASEETADDDEFKKLHTLALSPPKQVTFKRLGSIFGMTLFPPYSSPWPH